MGNRNYQKELDNLLLELEKGGAKPRLLLHACCAPCSSYCIEYLSKYFDITIYYYNPSIAPEEEFDKRVEELKRLFSEMPEARDVKLVVPAYNHDEYLEMVKGYENEPERGSRCTLCYEQRLSKTCEYAKKEAFDYFCTTLSISPYKDAERLMNIGERLAAEAGIKYLVSDFKKKNGYKRSIELSEEYGLYRQNYCGCIFSK